MPLATILIDLPCEPEDLLPASERAAEGDMRIDRVAQIPAATGVRPSIQISAGLPSLLRGFGMGFDLAGELRGHGTGTAVRIALEPRFLPLLVQWGAIPFALASWSATHSTGASVALCAMPFLIWADAKVLAAHLERAILRQAQQAAP